MALSDPPYVDVRIRIPLKNNPTPVEADDLAKEVKRLVEQDYYVAEHGREIGRKP